MNLNLNELMRNRRRKIRERDAAKAEDAFWGDKPLSLMERTKCDKSNFWDKNFIVDGDKYWTLREFFDVQYSKPYYFSKRRKQLNPLTGRVVACQKARDK